VSDAGTRRCVDASTEGKKRGGLSDLEVVNVGFGAEVSFTVTNTGGVAGADAAQVYVHEVAPRVDRPEIELGGFTKVFLGPGESKRVLVALDVSDTRAAGSSQLRRPFLRQPRGVFVDLSRPGPALTFAAQGLLILLGTRARVGERFRHVRDPPRHLVDQHRPLQAGREAGVVQVDWAGGAGSV
jgi:hypothetical protein